MSLVVITNVINSRFEACLASLSSSAAKADVELILVLDAADLEEQAERAVGALLSCARFVKGPRRGRAAARNAGAAAARGNPLVFVDGDILVRKDFLQIHNACHHCPDRFVRGPVFELIGAAGADDVRKAKPGFPGVDTVQLAASGFDLNSHRVLRSVLERAICRRFQEGEVRLPRWLASAGPNFSMTKSLWDRLGGQDESFGRRWGCEDLEMAYRAEKFGAEIMLADRAPGYHLSHAQPDRWGQHERTLARFKNLAHDPVVDCLDRLLGENGSIEAFLAAMPQA